MAIVAEASIHCQSFIESSREQHECGHLVRLMLYNCSDKIPKESESLLICNGEDKFVYADSIVLHVETKNNITKIVAMVGKVPDIPASLQALSPQRLI